MDPNSQFELGEHAYQDKNYERARYYFEHGAKSDHAEAINMLGILHSEGWGVPQDYVKSNELFDRAITLGNIDALYNLGVSYEMGFGVPQDYTQAIELYRIASSQGDPESAFALGRMLDDGIGVPQDYNQADSYELASSWGNSDAMYALGSCLKKVMVFIKRPSRQAISWYRDASEEGNPSATYSPLKGILRTWCS